MNRRFFNLLLLIGIAGVVLFIATAAKSGNNKKEIRFYKGTALSSINDFRENSIKGPQSVKIDDYYLEITGKVKQPQKYTYQEVMARYKPVEKVIRMYCVEGWKLDLLWEGIPLKELLNDAGILPGAQTVIFHSIDGYTTSIELDYVLKHNLILAYKINGLVLPRERGFPFQVAAEGKWGYKWAKWVQKIEISGNADYKGFWEARGNNRKGDISGPIFE